MLGNSSPFTFSTECRLNSSRRRPGHRQNSKYDTIYHDEMPLTRLWTGGQFSVAGENGSVNLHYLLARVPGLGTRCPRAIFGVSKEVQA